MNKNMDISDDIAMNEILKYKIQHNLFIVTVVQTKDAMHINEPFNTSGVIRCLGRASTARLTYQRYLEHICIKAGYLVK